MTTMWLSFATTSLSLLAVWVYCEWDLRNYLRELDQAAEVKQMAHDAEMARRHQAFCTWMDDHLARHFAEVPIRRD